MRRMVLALLTALLIAVVAAGTLAGCSGSTPRAAATPPDNPPPAGIPAFYSTPRQLPGGPGKLIKSEKVAAPGVHGTIYRVMYVSQNEAGNRIPVTGLVVVPSGTPPPGGFPVVSWAHGTNGMASICAPSLTPASDAGMANRLLDAGYLVVASDYQGEGTTGPLPYLVGRVAARNTIDIVRAVQHLAGAHASTRYAVWGHSEGGQTAMFALQIGPSYARDLKLVGVVAGAAPSQFNLMYRFLLDSPFRFYLVMAAVGYHVAYGSKAPLEEVLTPIGRSFEPLLNKVCAGGVAAAVDRYTLAQLATGDPFSLPDWRALLTANDPASFASPSPVPLLMPQGGADEQIPVASTQVLAEHLCMIGQKLQRWIYPGQSHSGVVPVYVPDMLRWLGHRFSGGPTPDVMSPTGMSGVQATSCG